MLLNCCNSSDEAQSLQRLERHKEVTWNLRPNMDIFTEQRQQGCSEIWLVDRHNAAVPEFGRVLVDLVLALDSARENWEQFCQFFLTLLILSVEFRLHGLARLAIQRTDDAIKVLTSNYVRVAEQLFASLNQQNDLFIKYVSSVF
jgi:hypothetical protein